jgi:hypothetical protein
MAICGTQIPAKAKRGRDVITINTQQGKFHAMPSLMVLGISMFAFHSCQDAYQA